MKADLIATTFPVREELNRAVAVLESMGSAYERIESSLPLKSGQRKDLVVHLTLQG